MDLYEASLAQNRIYNSEKIYPGYYTISFYITPSDLNIKDSLFEIVKLQSCIAQLIQRHIVFKSRFIKLKGKLYVSYDRELDLSVSTKVISTDSSLTYLHDPIIIDNNSQSLIRCVILQYPPFHDILYITIIFFIFFIYLLKIDLKYT
jgi:hypothetical protein